MKKVTPAMNDLLFTYAKAIKDAYYNNYKGKLAFDVQLEFGRKYAKVINTFDGSRSIHAFVDLKTGDVYMPASWNSPAKHVRYNLVNNFPSSIDWSGSYLYMR
jgi:hypothetical protein